MTLNSWIDGASFQELIRFAIFMYCCVKFCDWLRSGDEDE